MEHIPTVTLSPIIVGRTFPLILDFATWTRELSCILVPDPTLMALTSPANKEITGNHMSWKKSNNIGNIAFVARTFNLLKEQKYKRLTDMLQAKSTAVLIEELTSQNTSIPNRWSSPHLNIPSDGSTWGNKCIFINHGSFIKYIHQSSVPRHWDKTRIKHKKNTILTNYKTSN